MSHTITAGMKSKTEGPFWAWWSKKSSWKIIVVKNEIKSDLGGEGRWGVVAFQVGESDVKYVKEI